MGNLSQSSKKASIKHHAIYWEKEQEAEKNRLERIKNNTMKTDTEEKIWTDSRRTAYREMLANCIRELCDEDTTKESLMVQLEEGRSALRSLCADFGDNDWDDKLSLRDVIEKHLCKHLYK